MLKIILYLIQIAVFISLQIMPDDNSENNLDSKNKVEIQDKDSTALPKENESKELETAVMHKI